MSDKMPDYTIRFSHEIGDGPSGPARCYYDILVGSTRLGTFCQPPGVDHGPEIIQALKSAHRRGSALKVMAIKSALGIAT